MKSSEISTIIPNYWRINSMETKGMWLTLKYNKEDNSLIGHYWQGYKDKISKEEMVKKCEEFKNNNQNYYFELCDSPIMEKICEGIPRTKTISEISEEIGWLSSKLDDVASSLSYLQETIKGLLEQAK